MERLDAVAELLEREKVVVLELDRLDDLLSDPADPFTRRRSPDRPGIEDVALTLNSPKHTPEPVTVRVVLPTGATPSVSRDDAEAAMRRLAADRASASLREARAMRSAGRRQRPAGFTIAGLAAICAYAFGYLASDSDSIAVQLALFLLAGISITVAWVISWVVVETNWYDWLEPARMAAVYEIISESTLEITTD